MDSRTAAANGKIRTECVKNMNGLFETEMKKNEYFFNEQMEYKISHSFTFIARSLLAVIR